MAGWPKHIVEQLSTVTPLGEVDETEYYGPYNGLLLSPVQAPHVSSIRRFHHNLRRAAPQTSHFLDRD
jgi:hypothetical protein